MEAQIAPIPPAGPRPGSRRAVWALLCVTVLWGLTFVWMKQGLEAAERRLGPAGGTAGIGLFMSLRFGLAALAMLALPGVRRGLVRDRTSEHLDRAPWLGAWSGGAVIGGLLLVGFLLQMFGLRGVTAPVSAFLTSLYVVFTALLTAARARRVPGLALIAGAALATFGAGFIQGPPQLSFGPAEWLTVGCAFAFAVHILATEHVTLRVDPLPVTFTTFVWVTLGSLATLAWGALGPGAPTPADLAGLGGPGADGGLADALVALALDPAFATPMLLSCLLATVLALTLMNTYQRELEPVRAAILYAVEPVWASLAALGLGQAEVDRWLVIGGAALVVGNLIAELAPAARPPHHS
jgi:drug/metabolite transporter (DMT)-like permease